MTFNLSKVYLDNKYYLMTSIFLMTSIKIGFRSVIYTKSRGTNKEPINSLGLSPLQHSTSCLVQNLRYWGATIEINYTLHWDKYYTLIRDVINRCFEKCSKFTEHPCRSVISIKLLCNFIEITLWRGCFSVNALHIFRTTFY